MRIAVFLVLACAGCSASRTLELGVVGDEPTMNRVAEAARQCGFNSVRLVRRYLPPKDTDIRASVAKGDYKPGQCFSGWISSQKDLDIEIIVRSH